MATFSEYIADFSMHICEKYIPDIGKVVAAYFQTVPNAPQGVQIRKKTKGVFVFTTYNEKDSAILQNGFITYYYGPKEARHAKVHFKKLEPFKLYQNAKWLTISGVEENGLRLAKNSQFDEWLGNFGKIIKPTESDKMKEGPYNGNKKARIDLNADTHIPRVNIITLEISDPETQEMKKVVGKVRIYYRDQPWECKKCNTQHSEKCPALYREKELAKEDEKLREKTINTLWISDSSTAYVNEKSLNAQISCAPGSKIGHLANSYMANDFDLTNFSSVIFQGGVCNISDSVDTDAKWNAQTQCELEGLQMCVTEIVEADKNVIITCVPDAPCTMTSERTKAQLKFINDGFKKIKDAANSLKKGSVELIKMNFKGELADNELWQDDTHFTEVVTNGLIRRLSNVISKDEAPFIRKNNKAKITVANKYESVYRTWRVGCDKCTIAGHRASSCTVNPLKRHLSDSAEKNPQSPKSTNK